MDIKENQGKRKVMVYLDDSIVEYLDQVSKEFGIHRSAAVSMIVSLHRQSRQSMDTLGELVNEAKRQGLMPPV